MSDDFQYINVDDDAYEDAPKALREAYTKLKKRTQDQDVELGGFRTAKKQSTASDVLTAKGYDAKAAKFLIQSGVDLSSETAVDAWLAEDGVFFKVEADGGTDTPVEHDAEAAARQQVSGVGSSGTAAHGDRLKLANAEITPDMDGAAVAALYAKHGI